MTGSTTPFRLAAARPRSAAAIKADERHAAWWMWSFVIIQTALQLGLLTESFGGLRILMRSGAFGVSVLYLLIIPGHALRHPAKPFVLAVLVIMALSVVHPFTNSLPAGIAQFAMYVAITAPLFWMTRLEITERAFRYVMIGLWLFHTASAGLGVLQMHFPGRFQPSVSTAVQGLGAIKEGLKIQLEGGKSVWRPMGLTDQPGGAASAGLYAVVFGLGLFLQYRTGFMRVLTLSSVALGLFCLYISQIRSLLIMAGICTATVVVLLMRRGEMRRYAELLFVLPVVAILSFQWAVTIGGESTVKRIKTLEGGTATFYDSRGRFLVDTIQMIPEYPLGAGLARWGMIRAYFGDESNLNSPPIWVEIQFTAWLLDGGVPLIVAYLAAVLIVAARNFRVAASDRPGRLPNWGILLFALNIATIAVMFNYPLFIGQMGLEFWFLNAAFFVAVAVTDRKTRAKRLAQLRGRRSGTAAPAVALAGVSPSLPTGVPTGARSHANGHGR